MKNRSVVISLHTQLHKVAACFRCFLRPQLDINFIARRHKQYLRQSRKRSKAHGLEDSSTSSCTAEISIQTTKKRRPVQINSLLCRSLEALGCKCCSFRHACWFALPIPAKKEYHQQACSVSTKSFFTKIKFCNSPAEERRKAAAFEA